MPHSNPAGPPPPPRRSLPWAAAALLAAVVACGGSSPVPAEARAVPPEGHLRPGELETLASAALREWYAAHPVIATLDGAHDWDRWPPNHSVQFRERRIDRIHKLLERIGETPPAGWGTEDRFRHELLRALLDEDLFELEVRRRFDWDPGLSLEGAALGIYAHLVREYAPRSLRAKWGFWRMNGIPSGLDLSFRGAAEPAAPALRRALEMSRTIGPLIGEELTSLAAGIPSEHMEQVTAARERAAASLSIFVEELEKKDREAKPMKPLGAASLERLLESMRIPLSPEEIQATARRELDRIGKPADEGAPAAPDDTGSPDRAMKSVLKEGDRVLERLEEAASRHGIDGGVSPPGFEIRTAPEIIAVIRPDGWMIPPGARETAGNKAVLALPSAARAAGSPYLNRALRSPQVLLAGQAVPGTLSQAVAAHRAGDPLARSFRDPVTINGWAHYCEELLLEWEIIDEESADAARLLDLMRFQAARALAALRVHDGSWDLSAAVSFLQETAGLERGAAERTVEGILLDPVEALSRFLGRQMIRDLRRDYLEAGGGAATPADFHRAFLARGRIPVSLIREAILPRR